MESLLHSYGTLGIAIITLLEVVRLRGNLVSIEMKLDSFKERLNRLEEWRDGKN